VELVITPGTIDALNATAPVLRRDYLTNGSRFWVRFHIFPGGALACDTGNDGTATLAGAVTAAGAVIVNRTTRVACRRDATGKIDILVDGALLAVTRSGTVSAGTVGADRPFQIGWSSNANDRTFSGFIHAVAIHADAP
jgi:hypothetical protein